MAHQDKHKSKSRSKSKRKGSRCGLCKWYALPEYRHQTFAQTWQEKRGMISEKEQRQEAAARLKQEESAEAARLLLLSPGREDERGPCPDCDGSGCFYCCGCAPPWHHVWEPNPRDPQWLHCGNCFLDKRCHDKNARRETKRKQKIPQDGPGALTHSPFAGLVLS